MVLTIDLVPIRFLFNFAHFLIIDCVILCVSLCVYLCFLCSPVRQTSLTLPLPTFTTVATVYDVFRGPHDLITKTERKEVICPHKGGDQRAKHFPCLQALTAYTEFYMWTSIYMLSSSFSYIVCTFIQYRSFCLIFIICFLSPVMKRSLFSDHTKCEEMNSPPVEWTTNLRVVQAIPCMTAFITVWLYVCDARSCCCLYVCFLYADKWAELAE